MSEINREKYEPCDKCGEHHQNKFVNRCDFCRNLFCDECGKKKSNRLFFPYNTCYKCHLQQKKVNEEQERKFQIWQEAIRRERQRELAALNGGYRLPPECVDYEEESDWRSSGLFWWK